MAGPNLDVGGLSRAAVVGETGDLDVAGLSRAAVIGGEGTLDVSGLSRASVAGAPGTLDVSGLFRSVVVLAPTFVGQGAIQGTATVSGVSEAPSGLSVGTIQGTAAVAGASLATLAYEVVFPPPGPTTITKTIPSYLYEEYAWDEALLAMVSAYNAYTQAYVDYLNDLNLPVYTQPNISGLLLDWVGSNLYGFPRPALPFVGTASTGPFNTAPFNTLPFNGATIGTASGLRPTTDDIYKRCLTWQFFKGDGFQFSVPWLKRRVERFLLGVNGAPLLIESTPDVSVTFTAPREATITVPASNPVSIILEIGVDAGILNLPFSIDWGVTVS